MNYILERRKKKMVRLPFGYGVEADDKCYILGKIGTRKAKDKDGNVREEECLTSTCFPSSLADCIREVYRREQKKFVSENDLTLQEAIEGFDRIDKEFREYLESKVKDI